MTTPTTRALTALAAASVLLLGACGSDDTTSTPEASAATDTPSASETSAPAEDQGVTVDITIAGGKVTPQGKRVAVKLGETIRLHVVTDAADEIHVHSDPEHEFEVAPGDDKTFTFELETPGQVAVESHEIDATILQLVAS